MNYKTLGDYIKKVDNKNKDLKVLNLQGLSMNKEFRKSTSNIVGTDLSKYKIVKQGQFCCDFMSVIRVHKLPVVLNNLGEDVIISPAYVVFEIIDKNIILPEYLMMWFRRSEFDRYADFRCDSSIRGGFQWEELCEVKLPIPSIEEQNKIVTQYQIVENKIKVNEQICEKLEATAQSLYKHWFVDFDFPNKNGKPYKSSGGRMIWNEQLEKDIPEGWKIKNLSEISKIIMGQSPEGESYNDKGIGKIFYQGRTDFGFRIPEVRIYTKEPKRNAKKGDILMSVRAPVGDLNVADVDCCIGRGLAAFRSDYNSFIFYLLKDFRNYFNLSEGTGTIFSSINKDELFNLKVIFCDEIILNFDEMVGNIERQTINISKQNQKLSQLRTLLLSQLAAKKNLENMYEKIRKL
ncbi:restriction endonuclease subunit S [Chryseobacterium sp. HR92]|uniref:restriction endonuclease subunit S n=1 Tax=Chryseobacterium sp. HR92 TaxID=3094839 RepID=UPI00388EA9FD|nr:restriction endonuclease subunit S [Chryseobacterium sp. HR92]